jgi:beta-N-acetylhexosaminidase
LVSLGPLMIDLRGTSLAADERDWLRSPLVAGVILFTRNYRNREQLRDLVAEIHDVRQPPLLVTVDHEGGRVQRFRDGFFRLPPMRALGRCYEEDPAGALELATSFGWLMAAELRAVGIDMSFAPVLDRDLGLADVIGDRAIHSDSGVVAEIALKFAAGVKRAGMAICGKHFPTHAGAKSDSHTELAVDRRAWEELDDDVAPYRRLIANGMQAVMVTHVSFPAVDREPASLSRWWIETQLRGELGFTGAVISDDISMAGASGGGTVPERVRRALDAGCDLVLLCNAPEQVPLALDVLSGYVNPPAQLRLARLHGRGGDDWTVLHSSRVWQDACARLDPLGSRPDLELHG